MRIPFFRRGGKISFGKAARLGRFRKSVDSAGWRLQLPVESTGRIALLRGGFAPGPRIHVIHPERMGDLEGAEFGALAAPLRLLRDLGRSAIAGERKPSRLEHLLIVFTGLDEGVLTEADRDLFWRVFQVPIFEQLLGPDGSPSALECRAHDGLHIVDEHAVWETRDGELFFTSLTDLAQPMPRIATGFHGRIVNDPCACGQPGARLLEVRELTRSRSISQ